jgi:hypothetical protein
LRSQGHTDYKALKKYIKISEKVVENEMGRVKLLLFLASAIENVWNLESNSIKSSKTQYE